MIRKIRLITTFWALKICQNSQVAGIEQFQSDIEATVWELEMS